jgi:hypothetical protein
MGNVVGSATHPAVWGKQGWGGRSPGAVGLFDSASKLAHSKCFATSEAPGGHGGMRSTASLGPGGTGPSNRIVTVGPRCNPAFQRDDVTPGLKQGRWMLALQHGRCARGKQWPSRLVSLRERQRESPNDGGTSGVPNRGRKGGAVARWRRGAARSALEGGAGSSRADRSALPLAAALSRARQGRALFSQIRRSGPKPHRQKAGGSPQARQIFLQRPLVRGGAMFPSNSPAGQCLSSEPYCS